jgi:hypothetical protein
MITKHGLFLDREIKLRGGAVLTINHTQGIKRFLSDFFLLEKMVAPGLLTEINSQIQPARIAYAASHN